MRIDVVDAGSQGIAVSFAKDLALVAHLKRSFPHARWNGRSWMVTGTDAFASVKAWAESAIADRGKDDVEGVSLSSRKGDFAGLRGVHVSDACVYFLCPYEHRAVEILRSLPGARFIGVAKRWEAYPRTSEDIDVILEASRKIHALQQKPPLDAKWEARCRFSGRDGATVPAGTVAVGDCLRGQKGVVVIEELKPPHYDHDLVSFQHAYGRRATPEETQAFEDLESVQPVSVE